MSWTAKQYEAFTKKKQGKEVDIPSGDTNHLTSEVIKYLKLQGFSVWRQNNTAVYDPQLGRYRAFAGRLGVSDVIGFRKSDCLFCVFEIKNGTDRLSKEQRDFLQEVKEAGGIALEVRSLEGLIRDMKEYL